MAIRNVLPVTIYVDDKLINLSNEISSKYALSNSVDERLDNLSNEISSKYALSNSVDDKLINLSNEISSKYALNIVDKLNEIKYIENQSNIDTLNDSLSSISLFLNSGLLIKCDIAISNSNNVSDVIDQLSLIIDNIRKNDNDNILSGIPDLVISSLNNYDDLIEYINVINTQIRNKFSDVDLIKYEFMPLINDLSTNINNSLSTKLDKTMLESYDRDVVSLKANKTDLNSYVLKTGDTITGKITINNNLINGYNNRLNDSGIIHAHAEGSNTTVYNSWSHTEGHYAQTHANYSHAEGYNTKTYGTYSHAEGYNTTTYGTDSHAEGSDTIAYATDSHAEGSNTRTNGICSHASGYLAESLSGHNYSFVWNGSNNYNVNNKYKSHGRGTFNISPANGINGIYIGESTLSYILNSFDIKYIQYDANHMCFSLCNNSINVINQSNSNSGIILLPAYRLSRNVYSRAPDAPISEINTSYEFYILISTNNYNYSWSGMNMANGSSRFISNIADVWTMQQNTTYLYHFKEITTNSIILIERQTLSFIDIPLGFFDTF